MVFKWVKDNIIGDFAEERRKYESQQATKVKSEPTTRSFSTRDFDLPIVGESHYQRPLSIAKKAVKDYNGKGYISVILAREPDNKYDTNAVKVMTEGMDTIGYLSRKNAKRYQEALELWEGEGYHVRCQAVLAGGVGSKTSIGAWLDLAQPEDIKAKFESPDTRK